jgi:predicted nucleotidyltransferase
MATSTDQAIEILQRYLQELRLHNITVTEAFFFGSYVKGNATADSDIDIAIISDAFSLPEPFFYRARDFGRH